MIPEVTNLSPGEFLVWEGFECLPIFVHWNLVPQCGGLKAIRGRAWWEVIRTLTSSPWEESHAVLLEPS